MRTGLDGYYEGAGQQAIGRQQEGMEGGEQLMTVGVLLAKTVADLSFGGALLFYLVKFLVYGGCAFGAVLLGIKLRKFKDAKQSRKTDGSN